MAKRISVLNGTNKNQDYDFLQFQTTQLVQGVAEENDLEIQPQAVPDNTVIVKEGIANITVARSADSKVFNLFGEFTADENLTIPDTGTNPTWVCAVVAVMLKSKIDVGTSNPEDGTGVFDVITVPGTSTSPLTDGAINTALSANYYWVRLADVVQDPTVASGDITDQRTVIGVKRVLTPNDKSLRAYNASGLAQEVLKLLSSGDFPEFQIIPRLESSLTITQAKQLITKEYFEANLPGISVADKSEASASNRELFQNTDQGGANMGWKDKDGNVWDIVGRSFTYGETIGANKAVGMVGTKTEASASDVTSDTYVSQSAPTTNYNTDTELSIESSGSGTAKDTLLKFPLPSAVRILSFDLHIYRSSGGGVFSVSPISTSWDSATVTWNTKPTYGSPIGSVASSAGYTTISCGSFSKAVSDDIVANGVAITTGSGASAIAESLENAGSNQAYVDNIVYLATDGKIYKADASYTETADAFIGFSKIAGVLDDKQPIYKIGEFVPLTVTAKSTYYLSDTAGDVASSAGTVSKKVGYAPTTDCLQLRLENN